MNNYKTSRFLYFSLAFVIITNIVTYINVYKVNHQLRQVLEATGQIQKEAVIKELSNEQKEYPTPILEFDGPGQIRNGEDIELYITAKGDIKDFNISYKDISGLKSCILLNISKLTPTSYKVTIRGLGYRTESINISIKEGVAVDNSGNKSKVSKHLMTFFLQWIKQPQNKFNWVYFGVILFFYTKSINGIVTLSSYNISKLCNALVIAT